jgi:hypothetical protein
MTFQEVLERLRNQDPYLRDHEDNITLPMAEQIEANRVALANLMLHVHWQDMPMGTTGTPVFNEQALTPQPPSDKP